MTAQPAQPVENVGRGSAFALLAIPAAVIAFAIAGGVLGVIAGFAALVVPPIAAWLYSKGAGAPLGRAGRVPFIAISIVGIVVGIIAGVVATAYAGFLRVSGDGGPFGSAFATTLRTQLTTNFGDTLLAVLVGLAVGVIGIVSVIRGPRRPAGAVGATGATGAQAGAVASPVAPSPMAGPAAVQPPPVQSAPGAATTPPAPTRPQANAPSPGVILNGVPIKPEDHR